MSRAIVQPIGQKRLTNVAVVRLKSHGMRFEIACYKNKVLSWRSRVEKDIDEVLQSHTVYTNVSKGILAKSKDLIAAFGTDDQEKICLEILDKGELQVSGKEREVHLSSQFRDIATIVMQKTVNPQTQRPYTISMIERLMREIHFALEPSKSSKKQALELIRELEKQFPIVRAKMRLQLKVGHTLGSRLTQKLEEWSSLIEQRDASNNMLKVVCQLDPGHFRDCDALVRDLSGTLEVLAMAVQKEGDGSVDDLLDDAVVNPVSLSKHSEIVSSGPSNEDSVSVLASNLSLQESVSIVLSGKEKQKRCNTCNAEVGDALQHREHFKSDWHKHNLKRKMKQLPPLSAEDWQLDVEILDEVNDLDEYSR
ncbi:hypothetical protein KP509_09G094900 [Ceratopteris richardii]|uniref:Ribosome maturation protein SBDS n=1 Tax=Ceratopteris richardii TaxID=49495 RepID=A0A8T2U715_CERRI|nr:hypothetical protein KP509_09G094900 [Ceratopteris richardii]